MTNSSLVRLEQHKPKKRKGKAGGEAKGTDQVAKMLTRQSCPATGQWIRAGRVRSAGADGIAAEPPPPVAHAPDRVAHPNRICLRSRRT
jgi:hypothetical protein